MKCAHCGANLKLTDEYCPYCGRKNTQSSQHVKEKKYYEKDSTDTREKTIPDEILLKIWSVDEGINGVYEQEGTTLLLVPDVDTLFKLYENGIQLKRVSISRLPYEMGKEKIYDHVFVSGEERKKLGILLNHGIDLRIQMVPDSDAIYLKDIL